MIWVVSFFIFWFVSLKDFFFFSGFIYADYFSILMSSIFPLVLFIILNMNFSHLNEINLFEYKNFFFFIIISVSCCFFISSSFLFILFLELSVFPMFFLIFSLSKDLEKISSVFFMFFTNIFGSIPFMVFNFYSVETSFFFNFQSYMNFYFLDFFVFFCFFFIFVSKLPIFFLHFWLTKAHVSASGSCSMLLASLMLKLGSFGLMKFSINFIFITIFFLDFFLVFSIIGCITFSLLMVRFFDVKYVIACSSILHMALIFPFVLFFGTVGVLASVLMMVGHGLVSYFLFFLVTLLYEFSFNRSLDFNKSVESFSKTMGLFLFVYVVLNLGVPPFLNFISELFFCFSTFCFSTIVLSFFLLMMILSVFFSAFLFSKFLFGKKSYFFWEDFSYSINIYSIFFLFFVLFLVFLF